MPPSLETCGICQSRALGYLFDSYGFSIYECQSCGVVQSAIDHDRAIEQYQSLKYYKSTGFYDRPQAFAKMFDSILKHLERYVQAPRLLDVGCGFGGLVMAANQRGWDAEGIELSSVAAKHCVTLGLKVQQGTLSGLQFPEASFKAVVMNHVLEHVIDPRAELTEVHRILKPDTGIVFISVPNFGGLLSQIQNGRWWHLMPHAHLWHFKMGTIKPILEEIGFEIVETYTRSVEGWDQVKGSPKQLAMTAIIKFADLIDRGNYLNILARRLSR